MLDALNLVDLVIVAAALIGLVNGFSRGFWLSLAQYTGLLLGVVIGASAARPILDYLSITSPIARPLGAVLVLVIGGSLGSSLGYAAGEPIRRRILTNPTHSRTDSMAGAAFSTVAVLAVCWFLGVSFSRGPSQDVAQLIQRSTVLRALDTLAPRPPAFLAGVEGILAGVSFPPVFAGLEPNLPGPLPVPVSVSTPGVKAAAQVVVKIAGAGCGGLVTGSGFPLGNGDIATNAHVVSGTSGIRIQTPNGTEYRATVVFFDPERDFAILYAPAYPAEGLQFGPAARGTEAAVIGYPGGGPESVQPAVIDGAVNAKGRDIYNGNLVTREIWVMQSVVRPGNSGGPLVDKNTGKVVGIVFATSASDPNQAYALTYNEVSSDIQAGEGKHGAIDTSQYPCAA